MIVLHAIKENDYSSKLEEKLTSLVLAYEKIDHEPHEIDKPFIEEGVNVYASKQEISAWFDALERELKWRRSLSGDGCYIDPETGKIC